ncbi:LysR family transcriptional regulator [Luteimonas salinisoli]|nr:LysR family transcriptional regulator [Luteimonas salinisoli]
MTLDQLRAFVAVAEAGSFRQGAARLRRVQSAVSHAIANLEGQLGVSLFDRSGHRPELTTEGRTLLADARAVLLKTDAVRARAQGLRAGVEIELSIVVDTLYPAATVAAVLAEVRQAFAQVAIRLAHSALGGPPDAVASGNATLGILVGDQFRGPRLVFEALDWQALVAVVAGTHPLARHADERERLRQSDLADHLQIVQTDPTSLSSGRDFGVLSPGTWRVDSQPLKHDLIRAGLGWGILPLWLVGDDLAARRLVRLDVPALGPQGQDFEQSYLVHRIDTPLGPVGNALRAALLRRAERSDGRSGPR